jgi:hypothetical protein
MAKRGHGDEAILRMLREALGRHGRRDLPEAWNQSADVLAVEKK